MPAKVAETFAQLIVVLAAMLAPSEAGAGDGDFSLTSEIDRRFQTGEYDAIPALRSVLDAALTLTRNVSTHVPSSWSGIELEPPSTVDRWFDAGRGYKSRSHAWKCSHLDDDIESSFEEPTLVESMIAKGYPEGQRRETRETREAADTPLQPPTNHLASYSRRSKAPKTQVAVEGVVMRFANEGAMQRQYR